MRRLSVLLCTILLFAACSEPPQKEITRAQDAIDAARAAGAEEYAPEAFVAATTALQQSRDAVTQRDYRLALSRALEAAERAQDAAKQAPEGKLKVRHDSETAVNATNAALQQLELRLKAAAAAKIPPRDLAGARKAADDTAAALQKARAALRAGRYLEAGTTIGQHQQEISEQMRAVDDLISARTARPARRKK
jgi:hypothetical protein